MTFPDDIIQLCPNEIPVLYDKISKIITCISVIIFFKKKLMKERVSKLTYPTLQQCLRMPYTTNGNSKH